MAGGLRIADAPAISQLEGTDKLPVSVGDNEAHSVEAEKIKGFVNGSELDGSTVLGRIKNLETNLANEIQTRTEADTSLGDHKADKSYVDAELLAEANEREQQDIALRHDIDDEATARGNADATLQQNIDNEALSRQNADNTLQQAINDERDARILAVGDEATARGNADNTLQGNIDAEATTRGNADLNLQHNIDAEATIRHDADVTLHGNIDAERQARILADNAEQLARQNADDALNTAKANKNEMAVTNGTGANADKVTIQLKSGTSATVLKTHQDISGKADKDTDAVQGDVAVFNVNGNPVDSGSAIEETPTENSNNLAKSGGIWAWVTGLINGIREWATDLFAQKDGYYAGMAVGLAENLRGNVYADEQFSLRMTGGEANEVGGIGVVQQLKGAGAAIAQLFPEGAGHDFSGDVSLDGTVGNAEAVVRYSNNAATVEMGYLLAMEAFVSQTLTQEQLDAISAKDTGKQDRDKAVWLTPAGAITSAPTIESRQTEVTFSGWRIAMRVKASEVRDSSASTYWFTSGTAGRQVYDVAVAEGIDVRYPGSVTTYILANGWNTGSAIEYLNHMAAQGLPTHSVKAMSALLAVTKIGIKTVKSRNLLNPQTGRALLKAYVNDADGFLDNEYTMLGGLPSGSTMAFTSLLTGKTETLTMLDATHFVIPSDGWLQITGTLPESIIATWGGEKDNTAADEYATESHTWDVTQLFGTKSGGTEGHYYRFAKEGMRGAGSAQDVVELVGARGTKNIGYIADLSAKSWTNGGTNKTGKVRWYFTLADIKRTANTNVMANCMCQLYPRGSSTMTYIAYECIANEMANDQVQIYSYKYPAYADKDAFVASLVNVPLFYILRTPLTFTSLFLSASSTSDELTQMPADAIPLSEIQFADNNWSIEEAIYDAPEADANGVITPTAVTGQMRIQYSLDAAEQILTLQTEYAALEARVTALENA